MGPCCKPPEECIRGRVDVRGGMGGGETSRGGSSGASGACFTFGDVSPIDGSLFRTRGGKGGGGTCGVDAAAATAAAAAGIGM